MRMVAKKELFRVPVWGKAMRAAGMVEVDRGNHDSAIQSLERAREALARGISIWIAPEGTRSDDGLLGEFKRGGFHLAVGAGARILPVSIDGTRAVLPAKGGEVHDGRTVRVTLHAPVATQDFDKEQLEPLIETVRDAIASGLPADARPR
jgi:1-acyl-sn-glycerol-3-phosphate acyltransferase